jgi:hypothetical protein
MSELKPCPFCGGTDINMRAINGTWNGGLSPQRIARVEIRHTCPHPGPGILGVASICIVRNAEAEVIVAWNHRAGEPKP